MTVRIGILIGTMAGGGAQRVALDLMEHLPQAGFEPFLLSVDQLGGALAGAPSDLRLDDNHVLALSRGRVDRPTWRKVAASPRQLMRLREVSRRLELDVVLSLMERANIINLLGGGGPRRIVSVHSYPRLMMAEKTWLKRTLIRAMYSTVLHRADRVVFVSQEAALAAPGVFPAPPQRTEVIYNICDPERVERLVRSPLPAEHARLFDEPVVLACGRLIPSKGHANLIRAMAALRGRPARLVILGEGPSRPALLRLVEELDLADRVFLPGFQANPLAWMARSHVFALPSHREGLPLVLLEAMAAGAAVVAADCSSGPREILAPDTDPRAKATRADWAPYGVLTPPLACGPVEPAEQALSDAIGTLLEDEPVRARYVQAGRERARDFAPGRIIPLWASLIETVLHESGRREPASSRARGGEPVSPAARSGASTREAH